MKYGRIPILIYVLQFGTLFYYEEEFKPKQTPDEILYLVDIT